MNLLALDVSLSSTGYCVVNVMDNRVNVVASGVIPTNPKQTHGNRLHAIRQAILVLDSKYSLNKTVVRERGFSRFANETQAVYKVHGVVEETLHGYTFVDYPPATVKKTLTGSGKATKQAVADAVQRWLTQSQTFQTDDESDALAVAITHLVKTEVITT